MCDQLIDTAEKGGAPDWSQLPPSLQAADELAGNISSIFKIMVSYLKFIWYEILRTYQSIL